jgi:hypothetical protein
LFSTRLQRKEVKTVGKISYLSQNSFFDWASAFEHCCYSLAKGFSVNQNSVDYLGIRGGNTKVYMSPKVQNIERCRAGVHYDVGVIRIPGYLVKEKKDRLTPISFELRECLNEIKSKREVGVRHKDRYVLVRRGQPIKSIRRAWQNVTKKLKLKDCHQHGLRVAAVTDWENHGIPEALARRWCGHRRDDVHSLYEKFNEKMHVEWFARAGFTLPPEQRGEGHFIMLKRFQTEKNSSSGKSQVAAGK